MMSPEQTSRPVSLRKAYRHWVDVVERFLHRERNRRSIRAEDYQRRHQDLLAACRAAAGAGGAEGKQAERLLVLARPWLNTDLLEQQNPATLQLLLRDCRAVEQELGWRRRGLVGRSPVLALGLLLAAGGGAGLAWVERDRLGTQAWLAWRPLRGALEAMTPVHWLIAAGLAAASLGFLFVWVRRGSAR